MKPIYSSIASDPDLHELITMFVTEMPDRISQLNKLLESDDKKGLMYFAHQLKGSSGSYGFAELSTAAEEIVKAIKNNSSKNQIITLTQYLIELCKAASAESQES
ncbi:MAG: Hpt domain-containing protein [Planctomycetaceae bacterium]|jgi:HPt (histidine-containing phosphotransfer) domain-containing protein|nr:Hpt domain-containing protein [Planctomycetaceae bacterium]